MKDRKRVNTWTRRKPANSEPTNRELSNVERRMQAHIAEVEKQQQQEAARKAAYEAREKEAAESRSLSRYLVRPGNYHVNALETATAGVAFAFQQLSTAIFWAAWS